VNKKETIVVVVFLQFELEEVRVISIFFEFGGGCIHYNFTAKQPEGHQLGNSAITKLFFSEVDPRFRNENDVLLCCIVEENDAGTDLVTLGLIHYRFLDSSLFSC
jgi:hypothetical protein